MAVNTTNINAVNSNKANIDTVAGISSNVTTVAGISANVTAVANNSTNINKVADDKANIDAVAGDLSNINSVAGNETNINAAVSNATNINAAVANATNINTVAGNNANITTVAGNTTNINTVAGISSAVTTVATNVTAVTSFSSVYIGGANSDPTTRTDGSALHTGDMYFNVPGNKMRVYNADTSAWVDVGIVFNPTLNVFSGTGSQTAFTLSLNPGTAYALIVSVSGVVQKPGTDFTVSGTTLTFTTAPPSGTNNISVQNFGSAGTVNVPAAGSVTTSTLDSTLDLGGLS